jgi:hypothetical protein
MLAIGCLRYPRNYGRRGRDAKDEFELPSNDIRQCTSARDFLEANESIAREEAGEVIDAAVLATGPHSNAHGGSEPPKHFGWVGVFFGIGGWGGWVLDQGKGGWVCSTKERKGCSTKKYKKLGFGVYLRDPNYKGGAH